MEKSLKINKHSPRQLGTLEYPVMDPKCIFSLLKHTKQLLLATFCDMPAGMGHQNKCFKIMLSEGTVIPPTEFWMKIVTKKHLEKGTPPGVNENSQLVFFLKGPDSALYSKFVLLSNLIHIVN